ncbi:MAG: DUF445 family protein [Planctomycetota bacterium]
MTIYIVLPLIGALIGWCTNWLAVKMIFRPRVERSFLGIRVQGLLPKRRGALAENVAGTVERNFISVEDIQQVVTGMVKGEKVRALLHERIDALIAEQMQRFGTMVKMFISDDLIAQLKTKIEDEVLTFVEGMSGEIQNGIAEHLDIHELVKSRIESFDMQRLEDIVFKIAAKELRHIEVLGGVLGFVVGLVEAIAIKVLGL